MIFTFTDFESLIIEFITNFDVSKYQDTVTKTNATADDFVSSIPTSTGSQVGVSFNSYNALEKFNKGTVSRSQFEITLYLFTTNLISDSIDFTNYVHLNSTQVDSNGNQYVTEVQNTSPFSDGNYIEINLIITKG